MRTHNKDSQSTTTPEIALSYLREGNARFVNNLKANRNLLEQVNETRAGQWPFATILSCIDSRTSAELVFDQGLGDIFSIRLAGNVLAEAVLGSMEFACKVAGSRLLVVLGHTSCGAIKGACDQIQLGNLSTLLNMIQPSVYYERTVTENRTSSNPEFVDRVARIQVLRTVEGVIERSMVLREMVEQGEIGLVGAMYDVATGTVDFIEESWMCGHVRHFYVDASIVGTSARKEEAMAARRAAPRPAVAEIAAAPLAQPEPQPQAQAPLQPQVPPQPRPRAATAG
ncbi:MAG: carbonic anhydrase [Acidobacteria bacterium]|nr:carbonic anhydrase [Acidobacteriota bacterium]